MKLHLSRLRRHGLRKLNWELRPPSVSYLAHMERHGFDRWIELGSLNVVVGPNAGGKSTLINLLRALGSPVLWASLPRENYPDANFSGFDMEGDEFLSRHASRSARPTSRRLLTGPR